MMPLQACRSNCYYKQEKARGKENTITIIKPWHRIFKWMVKHQDAFDALKEAISTAPVLGYPDFSREFILETDASLNGLGAILSQQGKDRNICVMAYASCSLCPSERSMCNYSSAELELLMLKWAVMEKIEDYLLGSWFQLYMVNIPLTYVKKSKFSASQIWWPSELALFNFVIKYQEKAIPTKP